MLEMIDEAYKKNSKVAFYRFISFAALFYGKKPIEMIYTSKFPSNPQVIQNRHEKDLYIIVADPNHKKKLEEESSLVEFIREKGTFSLYLIRKLNK